MRLLATTAAALCLTATGALAHGDDGCAVGKTLEDGRPDHRHGKPGLLSVGPERRTRKRRGFRGRRSLRHRRRDGFRRRCRNLGSAPPSTRRSSRGRRISTSTCNNIPSRPSVSRWSISPCPITPPPWRFLTTEAVVAAGAEPTLEKPARSCSGGADANTTAVPMLTEIVGPERDAMLYGDNVDVTAAMQAGQIDAALFDLPTALYLAAVVVEGGTILGQFPADRSDNPDQVSGLLNGRRQPAEGMRRPRDRASDRKRTSGRDRGRVACRPPPAFPR